MKKVRADILAADDRVGPAYYAACYGRELSEIEWIVEQYISQNDPQAKPAITEFLFHSIDSGNHEAIAELANAVKFLKQEHKKDKLRIALLTIKTTSYATGIVLTLKQIESYLLEKGFIVTQIGRLCRKMGVPYRSTKGKYFGQITKKMDA